ncbi:MAG: hypothetical protein IT184_04425 [Acidobacteria bacterium]|nr:hypothetical protein [Acidobacteriota bacterium]
MTPRSSDLSDREIGGRDPIDQRLGLSQPPLLVWLVSLLRTRSALGLAPGLTPAVVFLPLGMVLGPRVSGVIGPEVMPVLDVVVTFGLSILGVSAGIALGRQAPSSPRLFAAASLESAITIASVALASAYFVWATGMPGLGPIAAIAMALGLSASASSATSADPDSEEAAAVATRVADLDDALPMVIAMLVVPLTGRSEHGLAANVIAPPLIGLAVGAIGWLLFDRAESGAERVVFVLGTLALAGGAASHLGVSPLPVGLVAGLVWGIAPGRVDRIALDDLRKVQHPLLVLLLVTAGALTIPSTAAVWLLTPYLLFRVVGKVLGAWATAGFVDTAAADLAAYLMPPGVLAVAFALNFRQLLAPPAGDALLSAVAIGTAAFELFSLYVLPRWRRVAQP